MHGVTDDDDRTRIERIVSALGSARGRSAKPAEAPVVETRGSRDNRGGRDNRDSHGGREGRDNRDNRPPTGQRRTPR